MAEIGVMRPLSIQRWAELRYGWNFIYRDRDIIRQMNGDRSNKWGGNVDMCLFDCLAGQCRWSNWRGYEKLFRKGTDIYTPHTHDSIDLLLDLDVGTLSYYSNQTFRGILKSGLCLVHINMEYESSYRNIQYEMFSVLVNRIQNNH